MVFRATKHLCLVSRVCGVGTDTCRSDTLGRFHNGSGVYRLGSDIRTVKLKREKSIMGIYAYSVVGMEGESVPLSTYRNMVVLIVNTATRCAFTPQYEGLEALYERYGRKGFTVLDFPCNQFKEQAPQEIAEIDAFCKLNYGTKFPRFSKIEVNGEAEAPLYTFLKSEKGFAGFDPAHEKTPNLIKRLQAADPAYELDPAIKWNFTKFLIDRRGTVVARFEPTASLEAIASAIEELL